MLRRKWFYITTALVCIPLFDYFLAFRWYFIQVLPDRPVALEVERKRSLLEFPDAKSMKNQLRRGTARIATVATNSEQVWPTTEMFLNDGARLHGYGTHITSSGDAEREFEFADKYGVIPMLEKYDRDWRVTELNSVSLDPGGPFSGSVILVDFGIVSIMVRYIRLEVRNGKVISFRRIWDFMS